MSLSLILASLVFFIQLWLDLNFRLVFPSLSMGGFTFALISIFKNVWVYCAGVLEALDRCLQLISQVEAKIRRFIVVWDRSSYLASLL